MKTLWVNMGSKEVRVEHSPLSLKGWGRGLISTLLKEIDATCEPLGPGNRLVFATGPFASTNLSSVHRLSVGGKGPLTGGIKEANSGGTLARQLAKAGYKAIVVDGQAEEKSSYLLKIGTEGAELLPAPELRFLGTYALSETLRQRFGPEVSICCVGPAGEMGMLAAGIAVTDPDGKPGRFAGRGGLGAVMGLKGLKAIVVEKCQGKPIRPADPAAYQRVKNEWSKNIRENHTTSEEHPKYGTAYMMQRVADLGGVPTRNFRFGLPSDVGKLNGPALRDLILSRGGEGKPTHSCCTGCLIRCSNVFADAAGRYVVSPLEYESIVMLGPNLDISSFDAIARLNLICNDMGLDTIETGGTLGLLMEAGLLSFGDVEGAEKALLEVGKGTALGRLVGCGAALAGKVLGLNRIPAVKGQCIPAYDPRAVKGLGITYATSPMGADHTAGHTIRLPLKHHLKEGHIEASRRAQTFQAMLDTMGICTFLRSALQVDHLVSLLDNLHGLQVTEAGLQRLGEEIVQEEREFNRRAGMTEAADRLPEFFSREPLPPYDRIFDFTPEELDRVFSSKSS